MLPSQPNQSLIDGLTCLQALAGLARPIGVRELARQLSLEPTRVQRLLGTLSHLGMAEQNAARKYVVGPGIHVLAAQSLFASGLIRRAGSLLQSLHKFGLTVALGVLWHDRVAYLYHATPGMHMDEALGRTGLFPARRSSIGMMLLAHKSAADLRHIFARSEISQLASEIRMIRKRGYALVQPNPEDKTQTLAVPVGEPPFAAIALAGRIRKPLLPKLVEALHKTAEEIVRT